MKLEPMNGYLLCERDTDEEITEGGIVLPETARGEQDHAKVIAVGADSNFDEGDVILISKFAGENIEYDNQEFLLVYENEVLARVVSE